ncbi:MAG: FMN-binding negative transcriptional regulator [Polyangiaceae bacterium]
MYNPRVFAESERETLLELIDQYPFATLISHGSVEPTLSHLPLLLDRITPGGDELIGHMARANRHWQLFEAGAPLLVVFQGPHGYISPGWYESAPSVPSWNYAVVHVVGSARVVDSQETASILGRLVERFESARPEPWRFDSLPADFVQDELKAIVGFRIRIERLTGKFKLSQNKEPPDRDGALAGLEREGDAASRELAAFSRRYWARRQGR